MFRLASIYVNANGPVKSGADLAGKRIGVPEWAQTAAIYTRGWMTDELGIPLSGVTWVQAGLNEPGRREQVKLKLPDGITLVSEPEKSLRDKLHEQKGITITHTEIEGAGHFFEDDDAHMKPMIETVTGYVRRRLTEATR